MNRIHYEMLSAHHDQMETFALQEGLKLNQHMWRDNIFAKMIEVWKRFKEKKQNLQNEFEDNFKKYEKLESDFEIYGEKHGYNKKHIRNDLELKFSKKFKKFSENYPTIPFPQEYLSVLPTSFFTIFVDYKGTRRN